MKLKLLISVLAIGWYSVTSAQNNAPDYSHNPVWIRMVDDPQTNYYEAQKAYDTYWKTHTMPEAENDMIGEKLDRKEKREREKKEKQMARMTTAEREQYMSMKYQCKRFENWMREIKPYVQENGHILTQEERTAIWNKQQEEMKRGGK